VRREYRLACEHAGKSGKPIERRLISTFRVAESMGFKGDYRQWEELLRIGD
jgi:hypothetical protein